MPTNTERLLRTQDVVPSRAALERFITFNPSYNGAQWADVLDILLDSDSHLDITEPLWDELADQVTDEQRPYIPMVAVTLHWTSPGPGWSR